MLRVEIAFGLDHLQLTLHNQLLENLHRSFEPTIYRVVADVVPAGNIGPKFSLISVNSFMMSGVIGFLALASVVLSS